MEHHQEQDYYEILEISAAAPQHEIHMAYQRAKVTYGQDNPALYGMFSREEAKQVMRLIDEAYSVLGNPTLRMAYDDRRRALKNNQPNVSPLRPTPPSAPVAVPDNQLPDFVIPEAGEVTWTQPSGVPGPDQKTLLHDPDNTPLLPLHTQSRAAPISDSLPEGHGRTKFSVYQLDPEFENAVAHIPVFNGEALRSIRKYKNLTLQQISSATNIGLHYLEALERNDFLSLPAAVFVRGFVSQYAKLLGLDERKVSHSYMQLYKEARGK